MQRTFELAQRGGKNVARNPQVGAVIFAENKVIGEGWHHKMGGPHAEINALNSVKPQDLHLLEKSKIFVSLEPCAHFGKTPPCSLAIIKAGIPEVHIALLDPTDKVAGKGVKMLEDAGIKVIIHDIPAAKEVAASFLTHHKYSRPKVLLKYAQSSDGFLSKVNQQTWLTNAFSKRLVHAYREKIGAILIGRKTAEIDNPSLTTRYGYGFGADPIRIVIDLDGRLSPSLNIFQNSPSDEISTFILTSVTHPISKLGNSSIGFVAIDKNKDFHRQLFSFLNSKAINTLLVEGGSTTLNSFFKSNHWDEALVFSSKAILKDGIRAPKILEKEAVETISIKEDEVSLYRNSKNAF